MKQGVLTQWHDDGGYGFVQDANGVRVFVHIKAFKHLPKRPSLGDMLEYQLATDAKGRAIAQAVSFAEAGVKSNRHPSRMPTNARKSFKRDAITTKATTRSRAGMPRQWHTALGAISLLLLLMGVMRASIPMHFVVAISLLSVATGLCYWLDKGFAQSHAQRISENTLLWLGVLGGWPGAWIAQKGLHHKSRKVSFQAWFWLSVALHLAGIMQLNSAPAQGYLHAVGRWVHQCVLGW